jgi:glycine/D-amino acid oxidase-like deaminating enzyme
MSSPNPLKVAVVGGGVVGVSTADQLVRAGAHVVLITDGQLASGASGRSLSWLNSAGIRSESYHRLRMAGIDRYRTLSAQHPGLGWLKFDGGLAWQAEAKADELQRRHERALARGYESHLLTADQVAAHSPGVNPAAIPPSGAVWNPGEGWVDLPSLIRFLAKDFVERGGHLVTNAGRSRIVTEAGAVSGVRSERGDVAEAEAVMLATGAAAPEMAAELGITIPDASPRCLLVTTKPVQHELTAVLNTPRASVRPTSDGALAVDSDWTTAEITQATDGSYGVPPTTVEELLAEASRLLIGSPELAADRYGIGTKPIPADGEPVLGMLDDVAGLYVAFTHSGATLALIAGELLAYEIVQGTAHPMLADFNARRFAVTDAATS